MKKAVNRHVARSSTCTDTHPPHETGQLLALTMKDSNTLRPKGTRMMSSKYVARGAGWKLSDKLQLQGSG